MAAGSLPSAADPNRCCNGQCAGKAALLALLLASAVARCATEGLAKTGGDLEAACAEAPAGPGIIGYVHLWVDADGETHLKDCIVKDLVLQKLPGGRADQYVRNLADTIPGLHETGVIVTQLLGPNPWHHCPSTQFVLTMSGTWYVNTTDGDQRYLPAGTWLFQDDTADHPAAQPGTRKAMHYSEAVGPCNQMVLQWDRAPVVGKPCPF
mmetsp:Transcript_137045/g.382126  ORF Transcript_137045/g.382126 Transcript_137045/m.382126 type:complete len:209 (-) Transcript_137045:94-720(-)